MNNGKLRSNCFRLPGQDYDMDFSLLTSAPMPESRLAVRIASSGRGRDAKKTFARYRVTAAAVSFVSTIIETVRRLDDWTLDSAPVGEASGGPSQSRFNSANSWRMSRRSQSSA